MSTPWQTLRTMDAPWIAFLHELSAQLERTTDCFVSWCGATHTLRVAPDHDLDADDSLAQIIVHELCHYLVQGPQSWDQDDWGLNNMSTEDVDREYAALRLQAAVLNRPLLRRYLQPTTEHRGFFDALGTAPLTDSVDADTDEQSRAMAHAGWLRWQQWAYRPAFQELLNAGEASLSR